MMGRRARTDNEQGPAYERQQAFLTWGGRQSISLANVAAGGTVYTFPGPVFGTQPIPGLNQFDQLVDVRYERPTAWAVQLYFAPLSTMLANEFYNMAWDVNVSVGKAKNTLKYRTRFEVITGAEDQVTLINQTIAAHTIQIIPTFLSLRLETIGTRSNQFAWSAWVAPLVD